MKLIVALTLWLLYAGVACLMMALPGMFIWNGAVAPTFSWHHVTYFQMVGLLLMVVIVVDIARTNVTVK